MKKFFSILITMLLISFSTVILAAGTITLYSDPSNNSKVVAKIPLPASLVEIFSKDNWIKVGDTATGAVGWVQQKTLATTSGSNVFSTTFTKQSKNGNQIIQYSGTVRLNKKQIEDMIQKIQKQQADMQTRMNKLFQQNMTEFNKFMQNFWNENKIQMQEITGPVDQAIIIVPANKSKQQQSNTNSSEKSWWEKLKNSFK